MKSVAICGSVKYLDQMIEWAEFLRSEGVIVFTPNTEVKTDVWETGSEQEICELAYRLTTEHFQRIQDADIAFVFNPGGYLGNSTTLEIGCAYGCDTPVWAIEKDPNEVCRDVLIGKYCPTKEKLLDALKT